MSGRARANLTEDQLSELRRRFQVIPVETRIVHEWGSAEGQEFLLYVRELTDADVPLAWIARQLDGMSHASLQQAAGRTYPRGRK